MAKNRLYKFKELGFGIPFEEKRWWILCKLHYNAVMYYLTLAGDHWDVLKGEKTKEPCYYCENPDGSIDPYKFGYT